MTVRIARICGKCQTRRYGDPEWECDEHPGQTMDQPNRPYFGVPTPTTEAEIPAFRKAAAEAHRAAMEGEGPVRDRPAPPHGLMRASDLLEGGDGSA